MTNLSVTHVLQQEIFKSNFKYCSKTVCKSWQYLFRKCFRFLCFEICYVWHNECVYVSRTVHTKVAVHWAIGIRTEQRTGGRQWGVREPSTETTLLHLCMCMLFHAWGWSQSLLWTNPASSVPVVKKKLTTDEGLENNWLIENWFSRYWLILDFSFLSNMETSSHPPFFQVHKHEESEWRNCILSNPTHVLGLPDKMVAL